MSSAAAARTLDPNEWERVYESTESQLRKFDARVHSRAAKSDRDRKQAKLKLPSLYNDIMSLEAATNQWSTNPRIVGLTSREVQGKANMVADLVRLYRKLEDALSQVQDNDRDLLLQGADFSASRKNYDETEETMFMSNRELVQEQRIRIQQEDDSLEAISLGLDNLKNIGKSQEKQLIKQDALLTELKDGVDSTDARMHGNIRRVELVEEGSRGGCCAMIVMVALLGLIVSVLASNWACHILPNVKKNEC